MNEYYTNYWSTIGYGINTYSIDEKHIDLTKLKELFQANKYYVNDIFGLTQNNIEEILKAQSVQELLNINPLRDYWEPELGWYNEQPLMQIVDLVLNQKDYGFMPGVCAESLAYIYLPVEMPWNIKKTKDLTLEKLKAFINESLKELYSEKYYDKIPELQYINCSSKE